MMHFICNTQSKETLDKERPKNEHLGVHIDRLLSLTHEESYIMPEGLTREQRRLWAKKNLKTK